MVKNKQAQKVALVTGASSGLGKDFAKALIKEGMVVYAAARRTDHMSDLQELGAILIKMDITKDADITDAVGTIDRDHAGVDVLINNAGFGLFGAVEDTALDDARYQFEVNLFGLARLTQLVIPSMRAKHGGKIINISSVAGKTYAPLGSWYNASKHALEGWSDCLRLELKQFGIDVVIIEPGVIKTEFGDLMIPALIKRSEQGAYAAMVQKMVTMFQDDPNFANGSDPAVITDLVIKAVRTQKPATRYVAGKLAKPVLFLRRWLSDRVFDRMIMSRF